MNSLPAELLLSIVEEVLASSDKAAYYDHLYDLMLVCSTWAARIQNTPTFWSFVDQGHQDRLPLILKRSDPAPLTIEKYQMGSRPDFDDAMFKESYRWESIHIVESPHDLDDDLYQRLSNQATSVPLLKTFCATAEWKSTQHLPPWNLFNGYAPKLEVLQLTRFPALLLPSPIFDNLHTLELFKMDTRSLSVYDFLRIVGQCQRLTALRLMDIAFANSLPEETVVDLPRLDKFRISRIDMRDTARIMTTVRLPRCSDIKMFRVVVQNAEELPSQHFTPNLTAAFRTVLEAAERATLAVEGHTFRVSATSSGHKIFDVCGGIHDEPLQALEVAATQWGLAELKVPVEIRINSHGCNFEHLLNTLRSLLYTTVIALFFIEEHVVQDILRFLGRPFITSEGVLKWHCPNLKSLLPYLCDTSNDTPKDFLEMLQSRYQSQPISLIAERPRRLRYLSITMPRGSDRFPKKQIRPIWEALQPEGRICWDPTVQTGSSGLQREDLEEAEEVAAAAEESGEPKEPEDFDVVFDWLEDSDEEASRLLDELSDIGETWDHNASESGAINE